MINKQQVICAYSDKYRSRSVFEGARMNVIYARPMIRTRRKVSSRRDRIWGRIFRKLTKGISHPAKGRRPYIRWRWLAWASSAKKPKVWRRPGYNRDRSARSVGRFRVTSKTPFLSTNSAAESELRSNSKRGACRRSNEYEGLNGGRDRTRTCDLLRVKQAL